MSKCLRLIGLAGGGFFFLGWLVVRDLAEEVAPLFADIAEDLSSLLD